MKKKKIKSKIYIFLTSIIFIFFIFFIFFKINAIKTNVTQKKINDQDTKNNNLLPPKPKNKWKYIKKLENL